MIEIIQGDALENLRGMAAESVQCCVTSPPYWGLRDYGTAEWEGGEAGCDHFERMARNDPDRDQRHTDGRNPNNASDIKTGTIQFAHTCDKCGAKRIDSQLGLEKTPEEYVAKMVEVFREVRRVLRKDGTLWLNMGSSMAGSNQGRMADGTQVGGKKQMTNKGSVTISSGDTLPNRFRAGVPACGSDDTGQSGSQEIDSVYSDLCDECRAVIQSRSRRSSDSDQPSEQSAQRDCAKDHDSGHDSQSSVSATLDAQVSTMLESFGLPLAGCRHCANCGACLNVLASASRESRLCARRASSKPDKGETEQTWRSRMTDMVLSSEAWRYLTTESLKAKDDCAIPWLVCLALRMDGWYHRCPIIWNKPNPMPESCTDRPTHAHEYLFLLTKASSYFYDAEAIKEKLETPPHAPGNRLHQDKISGPNDRNGHSQWETSMDKVWGGSGNRNKRSVWNVATAPYPEAHFATYPPDLVKPCIMAGTSAKGCCAKCGAPWERIVERGELVNQRNNRGQDAWTTPQGFLRAGGSRAGDVSETKTLGWQPTCKCNLNSGSRTGSPPNANGVSRSDPLVQHREEGDYSCQHLKPTANNAEDTIASEKGTSEATLTFKPEGVAIVPCTVLDPFAGSGTTGMVALELGRKAVLIELNPKYVALIEQRCNVTPGLALA